MGPGFRDHIWRFPKMAVTQIIDNYSQFDRFSIETHGFGDPHFKNPHLCMGLIPKLSEPLEAPSPTRATKMGLELWPQMLWAVVEPLNSSVFFARCNTNDNPGQRMIHRQSRSSMLRRSPTKCGLIPTFRKRLIIYMLLEYIIFYRTVFFVLMWDSPFYRWLISAFRVIYVA